MHRKLLRWKNPLIIMPNVINFDVVATGSIKYRLYETILTGALK
ncbi:MAG: hypothetical protein ACP5T0_01435 [Verrucomicrobiia bacterium]